MEEDQLTFWSEEHLASHFPLPDSEEDSETTEETSPLSLCEWWTDSGRNTLYGKTSLVSYHQMAEKTSEAFCQRWTNSGMGGHTGFLMLNTSESPSVVVDSSLLDILQETRDVPQKYFLSPKAAQGILRRANKRGKKLPETLEKALCLIAKEQTNTGGGIS